MPSSVTVSGVAPSSSSTFPSCAPTHASLGHSLALPPAYTGLAQNIVDLIDLHDAGEPVSWPKGFNHLSAKHFVYDFNHACNVCMLHRDPSPPQDQV